MLKSLLQRIRTVFLAGLLVTLPLAVTVWVIVTLVAFVDGVTSWLPRLLPASWFTWVQGWYADVLPMNDAGLPQGLGILVAVVTLFVVGVLARSYIGGRLIALYEWGLTRVPVASSIYVAVKELLELVLKRDGDAFEKVVYSFDSSIDQFFLVGSLDEFQIVDAICHATPPCCEIN